MARLRTGCREPDDCIRRRIVAAASRLIGRVLGHRRVARRLLLPPIGQPQRGRRGAQAGADLAVGDRSGGPASRRKQGQRACREFAALHGQPRKLRPREGGALRGLLLDSAASGSQSKTARMATQEDNLCLVDGVAALVGFGQARCGADGAVDVGDGAVGPAHGVVMAVADARTRSARRSPAAGCVAPDPRPSVLGARRRQPAGTPHRDPRARARGSTSCRRVGARAQRPAPLTEDASRAGTPHAAFAPVLTSPACAEVCR